MPRNITITFDDGATHVYRNAPDDVTPDAVQSRAEKEFGKKVTGINGGNKAQQEETAPTEKPSFGAMLGQEIKKSIPGKIVSSLFKPPTKPVSETIPDWARQNPRLYGVAQTTRDIFGPVVEGVTSAGGAVLGTPFGPAGNVAGAAGGYALGTGINRLADIALGERQPETAGQAFMTGTKDIVEGANWQAGGNVVGQRVVPLVSKGVSTVLGKAKDLTNISKLKAAKITREAIREDMDAIRALVSGQDDIASATASVQNPTWQALVQRGLGRDDKFTQAVATAAKNNDTDTLFRLAGGTSQTAAIEAQNKARTTLAEELVPKKNIELSAANQARNTIESLGPRLAQKQESYIDALRQGMPRPAQPAGVAQPPAAIPKPGVAGVHPETVAAQAATANQAGKPGWLSQGDRAKEWGESSEAFKGIAQQRRIESEFLERQIGSLEQNGLRPLDFDPIINAIKAEMSSPGTRASKTMTSVLGGLVDDLSAMKAVGRGGDAHDLYTLRKEGINERIAALLQGQDPKVSKRVTAEILGKVRPLIDDAIEKAGGTGWRKYLADYSKGMQSVEQKQMAAKLLELYEARPGSAAKVIGGDAPQRVEKVFGPGKINIRSQMAPESMNELDAMARGIRSREVAKAQATEGQQYLRELLEENTSKFKLPFRLNTQVTAVNAALEAAEERIGKKTMDELTKAFKSGKNLEELLKNVPASERSALLKALREMNPSQSSINVGTAMGRNALSEMSR